MNNVEHLHFEYLRLDRLAKISGKKGDYEKAQKAHRIWKDAVAKEARDANDNAA